MRCFVKVWQKKKPCCIKAVLADLKHGHDRILKHVFLNHFGNVCWKNDYIPYVHWIITWIWLFVNFYYLHWTFGLFQVRRQDAEKMLSNMILASLLLTWDKAMTCMTDSVVYVLILSCFICPGFSVAQVGNYSFIFRDAG